MINKANNLFIISGPSGVGEDSIIEGLKKYFPIKRVITTTTRDMRPGEKEGDPYYFISPEEFQKGVNEGLFFEWAQEYNDNYYGVTHNEIKRVLNSGKVGIWKIEYKGVITAKKLFPEIVAIFINAPINDLIKRIQKRGGITEKYIQERIEYTKEWLKYRDIYDYEVENEEGKLNEAIAKIAKIIKSCSNIDNK